MTTVMRTLLGIPFVGDSSRQSRVLMLRADCSHQSGIWIQTRRQILTQYLEIIEKLVTKAVRSLWLWWYPVWTRAIASILQSLHNVTNTVRLIAETSTLCQMDSRIYGIRSSCSPSNFTWFYLRQTKMWPRKVSRDKNSLSSIQSNHQSKSSK